MKLGINEEVPKKCEEVFQENFKDFISKEEFEKLLSSIKEMEEMKRLIEKLKAENKEKDKIYNEEIERLKIENAIEKAIIKSNARTPKAIRGLLKMENIKIDKDGNVTGVEEQIKELIKSEETSYLFEEVKFQGAKIGISDNEASEDLDKMSYSQMCAYFERNGIK